MQETKPYIPLYAAVWWEAGQHAFIVEMRSGDGGGKPGGGDLLSVIVLGAARQAARL